MKSRAAWGRAWIFASMADIVTRSARGISEGQAMAKRRSEVVAASLLTAWTDADTAMQIVGASLGAFGTGALDPTVVLARETPLRNALFDVLLSLVEGGALEIRATPDGRYAFRWRDDVAIAGLAPDGSPAIDLAVPSPYRAELEHACAERDEALRRAELAEALAGERERLLHFSNVRSPGGLPPDLQAAGEVVYLTPPAADATPEVDVTAEERVPRPKWTGYAIEVPEPGVLHRGRR